MHCLSYCEEFRASTALGYGEQEGLHRIRHVQVAGSLNGCQGLANKLRRQGLDVRYETLEECAHALLQFGVAGVLNGSEEGQNLGAGEAPSAGQQATGCLKVGGLL